VADVTRSREFYEKLLGFEVVEEDPGHGGVFMALEGLSHTYELPHARDVFRQGRGDRDVPLVFEP
jgi:catechol 2,3-dioxygenase-like lactoylglutathione lyase family enzyme